MHYLTMSLGLIAAVSAIDIRFYGPGNYFCPVEAVGCSNVNPGESVLWPSIHCLVPANS